MFRRRLPPWERLERNTIMETHEVSARAAGLFVVRSTDDFGGAIFQIDRAATYNQRTAHLDGVPAVAALGAQLLRSKTVDVPDCYGGGQVHIEHLSLRSGKAYLFKVGDYWHFWSMTSRSAARATTELLRASIETLRPQTLFVRPGGTLVEQTVNLNLLRPALVAHVDAVTSVGSGSVVTMTPEDAVDVISDDLEWRRQLRIRVAAGRARRRQPRGLVTKPSESPGRLQCREPAPFDAELFEAMRDRTLKGQA
jgi:hypothetical protein